MDRRTTWQLHQDKRIEELEAQLEVLLDDLSEARNRTFEEDYAEWKANRS
jgi:hypothetical protein